MARFVLKGGPICLNTGPPSALQIFKNWETFPVSTMYSLASSLLETVWALLEHWWPMTQIGHEHNPSTSTESRPPHGMGIENDGGTQRKTCSSVLWARKFEIDSRTGFVPWSPPVTSLPLVFARWEQALAIATREVSLADLDQTERRLSSQKWRESLAKVGLSPSRNSPPPSPPSASVSCHLPSPQYVTYPVFSLKPLGPHPRHDPSRARPGTLATSTPRTRFSRTLLRTFHPSRPFYDQHSHPRVLGRPSRKSLAEARDRPRSDVCGHGAMEPRDHRPFPTSYSCKHPSPHSLHGYTR